MKFIEEYLLPGQLCLLDETGNVVFSCYQN